MTCAILDTESSGLPHEEWSRVLEVGAVVLGVRDRVIDSFQSFVCPDVLDERADRALARNGITPEMLADAPPAAHVRRDFYVWMAKNNVTEVYAYNRVFDEAMLRKSGFELPWAGCVMKMARGAMPKGQGYSLENAARYFGIPVTTTHRALDDATLAAGVFAAIHRRS